MGNFHEIIELGLESLAAYLEGKPSDSTEVFYGHFILAYQRGDIPLLTKMESEAQKFSNAEDFAQLQSAIQIRLGIRSRKIEPRLLDSVIAAHAASGRWQGELAILLGNAFAVTGDHPTSKAWFIKSVIELASGGSHRKAHKARLNVFVAESHIHPRANLIPDYFNLYRKSSKPPHEELSVASTCLLNISREYQIMGSHHAALKYCTQALHMAEANFGSLHYYLILAHRAHLLCELERFSEALIDFECAIAAPFGEVKSALTVVRELLNGKVEVPIIEAHPANLLPTWKERTKPTDGIKFSELENRLLAFLGEKPRDKIDILEHIYGEKLSHEVKLNRFKSLIGTLRKKSPHLVICEAGEYRIADAIYQVRRKKS
jgi:tetratricopeptide (TPR) repeat protein